MRIIDSQLTNSVHTDSKELRTFFMHSGMKLRKKEVPTSNPVAFTQAIVQELQGYFIDGPVAQYRMMDFFLRFPGLRQFSSSTDLGNTIYVINRKRFIRAVKQNINYFNKKI